MRAPNDITRIIIGEAVRVHRQVGSGAVERLYEQLLALALRRAGLQVVRQPALPVELHGLRVERAFRPDLIVDRQVIVEVKHVGAVRPAARAQLLSYLKLTQLPVGLVINFGQPRLVDGVVRVVNDYVGPLPSH